jgi:RNA binding exosome subunit
MRGVALPPVPISYIDIRFFAHATEDLDKVVDAVQRVLPAKHHENITFRRRNLRGHYGNPIILFEARLKEKEIIQALMENLAANLNTLDKENLLRDIAKHTEKGSLYLRLDKQAAFLEKLKICTADPFHIRIRFRKKKTEEITQICRELGLLP